MTEEQPERKRDQEKEKERGGIRVRGTEKEAENFIYRSTSSTLAELFSGV